MNAGEQSNVWNGAFPGEASKSIRGCAKCLISTDDCYWEHADEAKKSFLHFFKGNASSRLKLNENFFSAFCGVVSDFVRIYMRSGDFYYVTATRRGSTCMLENGWDLIRSDHRISDGDYGVFTYRGPSEMRLRIFDHSGLEKPSTFVVGGAKPKHACIPRPAVLSLEMARKCVLSRNVADTEELRCAIAHVGHATLASYIFRVSEGNIEKGYVNFSKQYTCRCIRKSDRNLFLTNPDWSIVMLARISTYDNGIARITSGWKGFAQCNRIKAGSLCMFKMDRSGKGEKLRATVHVIG